MDVEHSIIIIGAGLAGCTLAWELRSRGARVYLVDRAEPITASKVAAGLVAPLSGPRLLPSWHFDEAWQAATDFYHQFPVPVFQHKTKLHLFTSEQERELFFRQRIHDFPDYISNTNPVIDADRIAHEFGGFEMSHCGWLDVNSFVNFVQQEFASHGQFLITEIDPTQDIRWRGSVVQLPRLGIDASLVIFCEGRDAVKNPFFPGVKFNLAKGEVLTVRLPTWVEDRVLFKGVWLFRLQDDIYQAGSTYEWVDLTSSPTEQGRESILCKLKSFINSPIEVLDHRAAVRPVIEDLKPMLGLHPRCRQLGFFNGLASKGALLAPLMARQFVNHFLNDEELSGEIGLSRTCGPRLPARLTEQAQTALVPLIQAGDIVIDATAGNGHDTTFLAQRVRQKGTVYAIDKQAVAIQTLRDRLDRRNSTVVKLIEGNHAELSRLIPSEVHGLVTAIMFNLGYLPHGDHSITTTASSTVPAIQQGVQLLKPGGMMTILAYVGHDGGPEEATAVVETLKNLDAEIEWEERFADPWLNQPPRLFVVQKRPS